MGCGNLADLQREGMANIQGEGLCRTIQWGKIIGRRARFELGAVTS